MILAVDPGPTDSAYVLLDGEKITAHEKVPNEMMLEVISELQSTDNLVVEQIASFGMPVGADVFETVFWTGRFCQLSPCQFARVKRHEVKMHLCGNMRAKDGNIRQALIDKLGPPGKKKSPGGTYGISGDQWSALAVAITFKEQQPKPIEIDAFTQLYGNAILKS